MKPEAYKVGEVARRTGLTVRTLHHYDEIGLLKPSLRTRSGHRLYGAEDLARLHRVLVLRGLGFSLEDAQRCLDLPQFDSRQLVQLQIERLREEIQNRVQIRQQLEDLARYLDSTQAVSATAWLSFLEATKMIENYYTPEQLEQLKKRREEVGEDAIRAGEQEWPRLMAAMKAEMEAGTDPADPKVQALARRWRELVQSFTGGDPGITQSLSRLWKEQGSNLANQHGMDFDPKLFEYSGKAQAALTGD